jgi:hypothetical protein
MSYPVVQEVDDDCETDVENGCSTHFLKLFFRERIIVVTDQLPPYAESAMPIVYAPVPEAQIPFEKSMPFVKL